MRVEISISNKVCEPYAVIHTSEITDKVRRAVAVLQQCELIITVLDERENIITLKPDEIFLIRVEQSKTVVYCCEKHYYTRKRLYEFAAPLNGGFVQISKAAWVNIHAIARVEPGFNGLMKVQLKNGLSDFISRKYLPELKKILGIGKERAK